MYASEKSILIYALQNSLKSLHWCVPIFISAKVFHFFSFCTSYKSLQWKDVKYKPLQSLQSFRSIVQVSLKKNYEMANVLFNVSEM